MSGRIKKGDFSNLAENYSKYRPGYNAMVVDMICGALDRDLMNVDMADVGAGTGIFTQCLLSKKPKSIVAVEPNDSMRKQGVLALTEGVAWQKGSAEDTGLSTQSCDLLSMASSFHWADTAVALQEFDRVLRPRGVFVAVWNPRLTDRSETEAKIDHLLKQKYQLKKRVSSGLAGITTTLSETLRASGLFASVNYIEGLDVVDVPVERYIGAWLSVNDIRSELGEADFFSFIEDVKAICRDQDTVDVHYLTRAWVARKP